MAPDDRTGGSRLGFYRQAAPMIVSRAGLAAMGIADGVMVAHYRADQFAWLSLAEGTLGRLLDVFVAFVIGALSLVARHHATDDSAAAHALWLRTIPACLLFGLLGIVIGGAGQTLLGLLHQDDTLTAGAAPVMAVLGLGFPAGLLAIGAAIYLESVRRPQFVAVCVVLANVLNIALDWMLIGGHLGLPELGARGAAWSTTLVRCVLALALVGYAWRTTRATPAPVRPDAAERLASRRAQWRLGLGSFATTAAMVALVASLTVYAGWLGTMALATYSAAWSIALPLVLVALGLSDAAGIDVAAQAGRGGDASAPMVAWSRVCLALLPVVLIAAALAACAPTIAHWYSADDRLRAATASVLPLALAVVVVDTVGFVLAASLRAVRDAAWLTAIEIGSLVVLVPLAAELALHRAAGVHGLFSAMCAAGVLRAALLAWRFRRRTAIGAIPAASVGTMG